MRRRSLNKRSREHRGAAPLSRAYEPYGSLAGLAGTASSIYGFTGEAQDATALIHLRERYYSPDQGRFLSRDRWPGDPEQPSTLHMWLYALASPMNRTDPSGRYPVEPPDGNGDCVAARGLGLYSFLDFGITSDDLGSWTCQELTHALNEMEQLDAAATVGLSNVFGGEVIPVTRLHKSGFCAYTWWPGRIEVYDPFGGSRCEPGIVGHELAHVWDMRQNISRKFADYVGARIGFLPWSDPWYDVGGETPPKYGGSRLPPNAVEDFAESLAEYVYDQGVWERIRPMEKIAQFVGMLLATGRMLEPARPFDSPNLCSVLPALPG